MNKIIVLNSFWLNTPSKQLGDLLLVWCQALRSRDCNLVASPSCGFSRLPFDFDPNPFPPSMTSSLTSCINDFSAVGELLSQGTAGWKIQEYQNMVHTLHAKNSQVHAVLNCSCHSWKIPKQQWWNTPKIPLFHSNNKIPKNTQQIIKRFVWFYLNRWLVIIPHSSPDL